MKRVMIFMAFVMAGCANQSMKSEERMPAQFNEPGISDYDWGLATLKPSQILYSGDFIVMGRVKPMRNPTDSPTTQTARWKVTLPEVVRPKPAEPGSFASAFVQVAECSMTLTIPAKYEIRPQGNSRFKVSLDQSGFNSSPMLVSEKDPRIIGQLKCENTRTSVIPLEFVRESGFLTVDRQADRQMGTMNINYQGTNQPVQEIEL